MKNIIKIFATFAVVILFSSCIYASDYRIEDYKVIANVNDDGNIQVEEYLKYKFSEDMNGLYRNILYKYNFSGQKDNMEATSKRYQASGISDIKVYTSNTSFDDMNVSMLKSKSLLRNGMDKVYSVESLIDNGNRKNIKVYSPVKSGNYKYVKYTYTIDNIVVLYNDYAEFYWNFIGGDWECSIDKFDLKINFDDEVNIKAYSHTYGKIDKFEIGSNYINVTSSDISDGTALDVRAVFPSSYISYSNKRINENYNMDTLATIEAKMTQDRKNYDNSLGIYFLAITASIIFAIILIVKVPKNKNIKTMGKVEHNPELPEGDTLINYSCIKNKYFGCSNTNLLLATILDLTNKKYIKMESLKKAGKFKDSYKYFVSVDTSKDFSKLDEYEIGLLNYIFNKKISDKIVLEDFDGERFELNERFKELAKNYTLGTKFRQKYTKMDSEKADKYYQKPPKKIYKAFGIGILIFAIILIINTLFIYPITDKTGPIAFLIMYGIFYALVTSVVISTKGTILKDEYNEEYNKLLGLHKYLNDYSLIKEKYPIELVLWERYLVFATLFGIASKVAKEFKEELIANGYDENYIYSTYPMIYIGMHSSTYSSYAASSTGSSSSGGYSGGGGGGRRWRRRRRRRFLKKCIKI